MLFEGHKKEDITDTVSDPTFTILVQGSDNNEKPMLIEQNLSLSEGSHPCVGGDLSCPVGRVESECSTTFQPQGTPLFSRGEEVDLLFWM